MRETVKKLVVVGVIVGLLGTMVAVGMSDPTVSGPAALPSESTTTGGNTTEVVTVDARQSVHGCTGLYVVVYDDLTVWSTTYRCSSGNNTKA